MINTNIDINKFSKKRVGNELIVFDKAKSYKVRFKKIDFSFLKFQYCLFDDVYFENCLFENSFFVNTKFRHVKFEGCRMCSVDFVDSEFYHSFINLNKPSSALICNSNFSTSRLRDTIFGSFEISATKFLNSELRKTTFDGTIFRDVIFSGEIVDSWFFGRPQDYQGLFKRVKFFSKQKTNIPSIDFTHAELNGVSFSRGIDLTQVSFPEDKKLLQIFNPKESLGKFLGFLQHQNHSNKFIKYCESFIDNLIFTKNHSDMPLIVIDEKAFEMNDDKYKINPDAKEVLRLLFDYMRSFDSGQSDN